MNNSTKIFIYAKKIKWQCSNNFLLLINWLKLEVMTFRCIRNKVMNPCVLMNVWHSSLETFPVVMWIWAESGELLELPAAVPGHPSYWQGTHAIHTSHTTVQSTLLVAFRACHIVFRENLSFAEKTRYETVCKKIIEKFGKYLWKFWVGLPLFLTLIADIRSAIGVWWLLGT